MRLGCLEKPAGARRRERAPFRRRKRYEPWEERVGDLVERLLVRVETIATELDQTREELISQASSVRHMGEYRKLDAIAPAFEDLCNAFRRYQITILEDVREAAGSPIEPDDGDPTPCVEAMPTQSTLATEGTEIWSVSSEDTRFEVLRPSLDVHVLRLHVYGDALWLTKRWYSGPPMRICLGTDFDAGLRACQLTSETLGKEARLGLDVADAALRFRSELSIRGAASSLASRAAGLDLQWELGNVTQLPGQVLRF